MTFSDGLVVERYGKSMFFRFPEQGQTRPESKDLKEISISLKIVVMASLIDSLELKCLA